MSRFLIFLTVFGVALSSAAEQSIFFDPDDGYLDGSRWLLERHGFIPVPLIITEPAVGFGGGAALLFMDRKKEQSVTGKNVPPTIKGFGAIATDSQSKAGFLFYSSNWDQDRWRYLGAGGVAGLNLSFYGLSGFPGLEDSKIGYSLDGWGMIHDLRRRIADSNWFVGGRYIYSQIKATFEGDKPDFLEDLSIVNKNAGLALLINFDDRDNTLSPQEGFEGEFRYFTYAEYLGGDLSYNMSELDLKTYWKWNEKWGGAARLAVNGGVGNVPFYAEPYINLRGIAKQRYQGQIAGSLEAEIRFRPELRWQYSVFGGAGKADSGDNLFASSQSAGTYGVGFRYLMARLVGFQMGLDIARGPEESVVYIQAGSAWP